MEHAVLPAIPSALKTIPTLWLVIGAAALYTAAMVGMKLWGAIPPAAAVGLIALAIAGAVWCEIGALRGEHIGMIYLGILVAETLCVAAVAHFGFDERFTARELAGAALIVAGTALAAG